MTGSNFPSSVYLSEEIIVVGIESEPAFKKMDTVVKLDSVRLFFLLLFKEEVYLIILLKEHYINRNETAFPHYKIQIVIIMKNNIIT